MQLDIISWRFKFQNLLGSSIILVLLFTLANSSLNENRAIEHCAMKYISMQWIVSFYSDKRKLAVLHSSCNMDGDRGWFGSSATGLSHVSSIYRITASWVGGARNLGVFGRTQRRLSGSCSPPLSSSQVTPLQPGVRAKDLGYISSKKNASRASQQLGMSPGWVCGDTLVKVRRTHIP